MGVGLLKLGQFELGCRAVHLRARGEVQHGPADDVIFGKLKHIQCLLITFDIDPVFVSIMALVAVLKRVRYRVSTSFLRMIFPAKVFVFSGNNSLKPVFGYKQNQGRPAHGNKNSSARIPKIFRTMAMANSMSVFLARARASS